MDPVRLALVGCGAITETGHLPAALRSPDVEVSALVDVNLANAVALSRRFDVKAVVTDDLDAVFDRVDGIVVATPNHAHVAVAEAALKRAIPTLIEKPLAITYDDALHLCDLADGADTFIAVGYRSRFWPGVQLLKHLLDTRYLGRPIAFRYSFGVSSGWATVSGFNLNRRLAGGGVLIDSHVIDKIIFWFGEPLEFAYWDDSYGGVESTCKATMLFGGSGDGVRGSVLLSRTRDLANKFVLETDRYICELAESPQACVTLRGKDRLCIQFDVHATGMGRREGAANDFQMQIEEFARNIRCRGKVTVDGRFAARSIKVVEAMYRAKRQLAEPWIHGASEMERAGV
jgi:predicted dehydrogenase